MLSKLKYIKIPVRLYHEKVINHYENPKNIGTFDKNDPNVGSALIGAPACIRGDTLIAIADGRSIVPIEKLYNEDKIIKVWSYNLNKNKYEIKNAKVIKQNYKKNMKKITFNDNSYLICTPDHKLLLKNNKYIEINDINKKDSIIPFKKNPQSEMCESCNEVKIIKIENLYKEYDCYDLQVEENNNYAIITKHTDCIQSGLIIKNCGDVMKLQIKVDKNTGIITDTCFKTFGCGSAIASSSYSTELIKNMHLDEANNVTNMNISKELNLPPVKLHCSMLAEDAIKSAINDYKSKNKVK